MEIKFESSFLSFEISVKRSTNDDPITQDTVEKCIRIAMMPMKVNVTEMEMLSYCIP